MYKKNIKKNIKKNKKILINIKLATLLNSKIEILCKGQIKKFK